MKVVMTMPRSLTNPGRPTFILTSFLPRWFRWIWRRNLIRATFAKTTRTITSLSE